MSLKTLAEAIIFQAAEDFLSGYRCEEDVEFFSGEGFRICSEMAGMSHTAQCSFLGLISRCGSLPGPSKMYFAEKGGMRPLHYQP
jgi:hypothetical protein